MQNIKKFTFKFILTTIILGVILSFLASYFVNFTAVTTTGFLKTIGLQASNKNNLVFLSPMLIKIIPACTGFISTAVLLGFILSFPTDKNKKIIGLALTPLIYFSTILRLGTSLYIGSINKQLFPLVHNILWQGTMFIITILLIVFWIHFIITKKELKKAFV